MTNWVVVIAGSRWDDVVGTDHQLAWALAERVEVLWVDPAYPVTAVLGSRPPVGGLHQVAPGLHRLQPVGPPGASRPGVRRLAELTVQQAIRAELERRGIRPLATVVLGPRTDFPRGIGGVRALSVTDDWVAGAPLMGWPATWLASQLRTIARHADVVTAVTPTLAGTVQTLAGLPLVEVLPNGTRPFGLRPDIDREPVAGLVGQLNERLDYAALAEVADRGVRLRIIGPRTARDPQAIRDLDALLERPQVKWAGPIAYEDLGSHLARLSVGLTPYLDTDFNRASFPLKTLEYLGAGLPVVSSDLAAARWLETDHVRIAPDRWAFADEVETLIHAPGRPAADDDRVRFAEGHSWSARADQLLDLLRPAGLRAHETPVATAQPDHQEQAAGGHRERQGVEEGEQQRVRHHSSG